METILSELPEVSMIHVAVTGTHSAGKTTLLADFAANNPPLSDVWDGKLHPYLKGTYREINGIIVPIILTPEAATMYAEYADEPSVVTDCYTHEHQVAMEEYGNTLSHMGDECARIVAGELDQKTRLGVTISDRSPLDGYVYEVNRLPDQEHELVDLGAIIRSTNIGLASAEMKPVYLRQVIREAAAVWLDAAYVTDHREVDFEDNGMRQTDLEFRSSIASGMWHYYRDVLGKDKVSLLSGSRSERLATLNSSIGQLIVTKLGQQTSVV